MKNEIGKNKEELDKLMNEIGLANYIDEGVLETWAAEIMECGKRVSSYNVLTEIASATIVSLLIT